MKNLRGIIMCGGQSKRMGTDKGLIPIGDTCWGNYMADKIKNINLPVSISINISQFKKYKMFFPEDKLIVDSQNIAGPVNGLISVHAKYPNDDLLLLACDMIDMEVKTLDHLLNSYRYAPKFDFYTYQNQQFAEPFCSIYTAEALHILSQQPNNSNTQLSLQKLLMMGNTKFLEIKELASFNNHNTLD